MSGTTCLAQVQMKSDFTKTALVASSGPSVPLGPSSLRVKTTILGLSINNQAYAISGTFLSWWDIFPVSSSFPSPYNDDTTYGILGGWGYATVLQSTIAGVEPGQLVSGFLPLSTVPVDLELKPAKYSGHFIEVSAHRSKAMALYQRYKLAALDPESSEDQKTMAREALVGILWECSYLLNKYSFAASHPVINPAGDDLPWTESQANLSGAAVICLGASGKTAITLASELQRRAAENGPVAVVGVTSAQNVEFVKATGVFTTAIGYDAAIMSGATALHEKLKDARANRVMMLDFGARGTFTPEVHAALKASGVKNLTTIRVGFEHKPYTQDMLMQDVFARGAALDMVQMNTSPLREQVLREVGEEEYFDEMTEAKKAFFDRGGIKGLRYRWREGMTGDNGLEGVWETLCASTTIDPRDGFVLKL